MANRIVSLYRSNKFIHPCYSFMRQSIPCSANSSFVCSQMLRVDSDYLDAEDRHLTAEVHWLDSHLLYNDHDHHQLSELTDQHRHQMKSVKRRGFNPGGWGCLDPRFWGGEF